jgi:hypothetical protein
MVMQKQVNIENFIDDVLQKLADEFIQERFA